MIVNQKAREISLATLKISVYVRRTEFRKKLEKLSFDLLDAVTMSELETATKLLESLESFVIFGRDIYEIEPINADILSQKIQELNKTIANSKDMLSITHVALSDIFKTEPEYQVEKKEKAKKKEAAIDNTATATNNAAINTAMEKKAAIAVLDESQNMRQTAIIDKIRQWGDKQAQMKDVIAAFPQVSERTIRYDLQRLCAEGIIERVGQGGPGSYYKIRVI